jgi:hypothetical protein
VGAHYIALIENLVTHGFGARETDAEPAEDVKKPPPLKVFRLNPLLW